MIKVGSDFSGVGAFEQALIRLGIKHNTVFACDDDKFVRETYALNFGAPVYYPKDVYDREIPIDPLDIYVSTPPCQTFSIAGNRTGENDKRGILFYNTHEFILKNKPRYFIIENVKGLLSHNSGKTFQNWIDLLAGKSVNGNPVIFPHEDSTPYHIYYKVLNAKKYNIPQNRERIFIVGIRDDKDNNFSFPKTEQLTKKLSDILEKKVHKKYNVSEKMISGFETHKERNAKNGNGFGFRPKTQLDAFANTIGTKSGNRNSDNFIEVGTLRTHNDGKGFRFTKDNSSPTLPARARQDGSGQVIINIGTSRSKRQQKRKFRRLTPLECFRLMDFNKNFKWNVSDTQAYKQGGNSICVGVLAKIIKRLNLNP